MKTLYLLRHAHPETNAPSSMGDHERVLSPRGIAEAHHLGDFMIKENIMPDFVMCSSAARTTQTVQGMYERLFKNAASTIPSTFDRALYLASPDALLNAIAQADDDIEHLLIVAHNPGMASLAFHLSQGELADHTMDFAPGTFVVFKTEEDNWQNITPTTVQIEKVFVP